MGLFGSGDKSKSPPDKPSKLGGLGRDRDKHKDVGSREGTGKSRGTADKSKGNVDKGSDK